MTEAIFAITRAFMVGASIVIAKAIVNTGFAIGTGIVCSPVSSRFYDGVMPLNFFRNRRRVFTNVKSNLLEGLSAI